MSDFSESFDARDWAKAFVEHVKASPTLATDEETMVSWFASAIMRGFDEHAWRFPSDALVHAVALMDLSPDEMSRRRCRDDVIVAALAFARPHVDPGAYADGLRAARGSFTRDPEATEHRPVDQWPHGE